LFVYSVSECIAEKRKSSFRCLKEMIECHNMKCTRSLVFIFILFFGGVSALAQGKVSFTGIVQDEANNQPVPFATVLAISNSTQNMIAGSTTLDDGSFAFVSDSTDVFLEFSFIGYEKKAIQVFSVVKGTADLGIIFLSASAEMLNEVDIVAEQSTFEFKLDKRVFNVGKDISSTGMSAMEVLNNVPSVNVNIEGEVTLRGNSGVQILIDGKPSVLSDEASNALGTITADMIESIEVITNPSAKYEAEGTSGIINIVLKKEEKKGFNGSVSVNTGMPANHSIGASLNYRASKFNFFTQFGVGYRARPNFDKSINRNLIDNTQVLSAGTGNRNEQFYNITLGTDYYINKLNTITLSGNFAYEIEDQPSNFEFTFYDSEGSLVAQYERIGTGAATNPKYQYDLQYVKQFANDKEHKLLFSTLGSFFGKDLTSDFVNSYSFGEQIAPTQRTETNFYQANYTFKLDYTNPISKKITLEAGGMYELNDVGNDYAVLDEVDNVFVVDSSLTNDFRFDQKVFGVYGTASYESGRWGVKLGFRLENTDLSTLLANTNEENKQNYTNLFPSVHTSFKITETVSVQAGYSKRIYRPRLWDLNPFFNIQNNFNIRTGNPNLQPEFADSYELTSIFLFEKASLNASIYQLYTTDVKERISYFNDNVNITSPENVGTNRKTGFEINGKYTVTKWLTVMGDFNYGFFSRQGQFEEQNFDFTGDQWSSRITTKIKLPKGVDVELSPNYQSGFLTVQSEVSGYASLDFGVRKKLWKGKAVANLGVRDVFETRIRESIIDQPGFYLYSFSQRGRFVTLGFSYSFGKGEAMSYSGGGRR
jgi:outer membrane receptor protein involved in Fe transport